MRSCLRASKALCKEEREPNSLSSAYIAGFPEDKVSEKIMALHPAGKQGVNIDRNKYDTVRQAIEQVLQAQPEATFSQLTDAVGQRIGDSFEGSVSWYLVSVKLDMEARGVLERVDGRSPQRLRLVDVNAKV